MNEQLFASKYQLVLPSEAELKAEMERDPVFKLSNPGAALKKPTKRPPKTIRKQS